MVDSTATATATAIASADAVVVAADTPDGGAVMVAALTGTQPDPNAVADFNQVTQGAPVETTVAVVVLTVEEQIVDDIIDQGISEATDGKIKNKEQLKAAEIDNEDGDDDNNDGITKEEVETGKAAAEKILADAKAVGMVDDDKTLDYFTDYNVVMAFLTIPGSHTPESIRAEAFTDHLLADSGNEAKMGEEYNALVAGSAKPLTSLDEFGVGDDTAAVNVGSAIFGVVS